MSRLEWGSTGRYAVEGLSSVALYPEGEAAFVWNGVKRFVDGTPVDASVRYQDGQAFIVTPHSGLCGGEIEALTLPDQLQSQTGITGIFEPSITRKEHGMVLLEGRGNLARLHMLWNVVFRMDNEQWQTLGEQIVPSTYTLEFRANRSIPGRDALKRHWNPGLGRNYSHLVVEYGESFRARYLLEDMLFGTDDTEPRWPTFDEIVLMIDSNPNLRVVDNGDGTWTAESDYPGQIVQEDDYFEIHASTAYYLSDDAYALSDSE